MINQYTTNYRCRKRAEASSNAFVRSSLSYAAAASDEEAAAAEDFDDDLLLLSGFSSLPDFFDFFSFSLSADFSAVRSFFAGAAAAATTGAATAAALAAA